MIIDNQISLADIDSNYQAFVDKFKPKKTTDDCYTPENIYNVILDWVADEYGIDREKAVRPFWPGGDYLRFDYPDGGVVVDNPPFSIVSQICADYVRAGISFFLFAPHLTNFSSQSLGVCHVIANAEITYENGACVNTSFLTNLETIYEARTAPELRQRIKAADAENRRAAAVELPKYEYPAEVLTAAMMGQYCRYGVDYRVRREDCRFIRQLDAQKAVGKSIFGSGYLLSEKAAAEKAAAEKAAAEKARAIYWPLSKEERRIIEYLGRADQ